MLDLHDLATILSIQVDRQVSNDFVVRHRNRFFQLGPKQPVRVCRKAKVCVQERIDGSIHIVAKGRRLKFHELPARPPRRPAARVVRTKDLAAKPRCSKRRCVSPFGAFTLASNVPTNPPASALRQ